MPEYLKEIDKIVEAFHSGNLTMAGFKEKIAKLWRENRANAPKASEGRPGKTISPNHSLEKTTRK